MYCIEMSGGDTPLCNIYRCAVERLLHVLYIDERWRDSCVLYIDERWRDSSVCYI